MSDAELEYGPTPEDAEYEHTDIDPGIATSFAVWLAIAMALSAGIVYSTFWLFEGRTQTWNQDAVRFPLAAGQAKEPPSPRLQTQPFRDVWQLREGQLERLRSYGWVDQSTGVVHIPIDEAMRLMVERGAVPTRTGPTPLGVNRYVPDSSAGRELRNEERTKN
jgi:hypothetical protein